MVEFEDDMRKNTQFFSTSGANDIFMTLVSALESEKNVYTYKVSNSKWQCKINHKAGNRNVKLSVYLYEVNENKLCVDFTRLDGSAQLFTDVYKKVVDKLNHHNDITN